MTELIVNVDQAEAWDGEEGAHWADHEERYDATLRRHHPLLLAAAGIGAAERILDVGCGCGRTTRDAARAAPEGHATGADLSSPMLERARRRAAEEGVANVTFLRADAQVHSFPAGGFDLVMSRFGVMFFSDPAAAFTNLGRALRPGGRLVVMAWRRLEDNEWLSAVRAALAAGRTLPAPPANAPGPFGLADPDSVRDTLTSAGFGDIALDPVDEPVWFGADAADAYGFLSTVGPARGMLADLDPPAQEAALDRLRATLTEHETADGVVFGSAAWLITGRR